MKRVINTTNAPAALGPYSQAIEANGVLYVSGQIPFVPATMTLVSEDVEAQTKQSLENIGAILKEAGYDFKDVVSATVYIKNMNDFTKINGVYDKYLGDVEKVLSAKEIKDSQGKSMVKYIFKLKKDIKKELLDYFNM